MFSMDKSRALHDRASESLILGVSTAFRRKVTPVLDLVIPAIRESMKAIA